MPSIHLTDDQVRQIVHEDTDKYLLIEEDIDYEGLYKDYVGGKCGLSRLVFW